MDLTHIEDLFVNAGGQFITSAFDLRDKLSNIKAYVFDWDGVFNSGRKGLENTSDFSEVDSMGVNMLRFGHFLQNSQSPYTVIITGEANPAALKWAEREHFNAVYTRTKEKDRALLHFCEENGITPSELCYCYDDILDIPVARIAGISLAVKKNSNPVFIEYLKHRDLADYFSGSAGHEHAVREFCELLLCLMGKQFEVIDKRADFDADYQNYFEKRQKTETKILEYGRDY